MHLIPKSTLYGQPARSIRDFMRHVGLGTFDEPYLRVRLKLSAHAAKAVLAGLLADQYIDLALPRDGVSVYGLTGKGGQLASASFAAPIRRAVGEHLLAGVLDRARDAGAQEAFVFRVTKIALFGSMLGTTPLVSDVDLALQLAPRFDGDQFTLLNQQRIDLAEQSGKRFRSMIESVVWPRLEVSEYLRGGSRYVSIHSFMELELLKCPFHIVFESPQLDTSTWSSLVDSQ
jgi:predicted nucleotidyltransferase